jgi:hypothetical protein
MLSGNSRCPRGDFAICETRRRVRFGPPGQVLCLPSRSETMLAAPTYSTGLPAIWDRRPSAAAAAVVTPQPRESFSPPPCPRVTATLRMPFPHRRLGDRPRYPWSSLRVSTNLLVTVRSVRACQPVGVDHDALGIWSDHHRAPTSTGMAETGLVGCDWDHHLARSTAPDEGFHSIVEGFLAESANLHGRGSRRSWQSEIPLALGCPGCATYSPARGLLHRVHRPTRPGVDASGRQHRCHP